MLPPLSLSLHHHHTFRLAPTHSSTPTIHPSHIHTTHPHHTHTTRSEGNLIWPVLLDNVTPDMRIAWEEPFGPVLPIMRVPDVDVAVAHCNSSNLGLQGCVFTRDINAAMRISDAMQTGTVQVGGWVVCVCVCCWVGEWCVGVWVCVCCNRPCIIFFHW